MRDGAVLWRCANFGDGRKGGVLAGDGGLAMLLSLSRLAGWLDACVPRGAREDVATCGPEGWI